MCSRTLSELLCLVRHKSRGIIFYFRKEALLKNWIRKSHRWLSIAFTVFVIINIAVLGQDESTRMQVAFLPLLPLAFLLFSGLYLFALPYAAKWRGER